jgi:hypothetical protein
MPYHLPVLSKPDFGLVRAPGPGFGNLLFPIARAVIGQAEVGGDLVLPTMRQIKLGTFLRGERDKRTYGDLFRHRSVPELHRWGLAHLHRHFGSSHRSPDQLFVYEGMGRQFHDLGANASLVERFLIQRSRLPPPTARYNLAIWLPVRTHGYRWTGTEQRMRRRVGDWEMVVFEGSSFRMKTLWS